MDERHDSCQSVGASCFNSLFLVSLNVLRQMNALPILSMALEMSSQNLVGLDILGVGKHAAQIDYGWKWR